MILYFYSAQSLFLSYSQNFNLDLRFDDVTHKVPNASHKEF